MVEIQLPTADSGGSCSAHVDDVLVITLDETPTSGYRWEFVDLDENILTVAGDTFEPPAGATRGGVGSRVFRLRVVAPGTARLRLWRRRAWEDERSITDRFEMTVNAEERGAT
jgi:inhibitor of cysteine peptidase